MTEHALEEFGSGLGSSLVVLNLYCPRVDADNQSRLEYQHKFYTALMERCMAMKNAGKYAVFHCVCVCCVMLAEVGEEGRVLN